MGLADAVQWTPRDCDRVQHARHAMGLDDERRTFHPIPWDERAEKRLRGSVDPDRLTQVWFPGMHADVGGGYPDDGLSFVPLNWMIEEAAGKGLRFSSHRWWRDMPRLPRRLAASMIFALRVLRVPVALPAARRPAAFGRRQHATRSWQRDDPDGMRQWVCSDLAAAKIMC